MSAQPPATDPRARLLGEDLLRQMSVQAPDVSDILWLVRNGASMSVTDRNGLTPLLRAMSWGNRILIGEMVERGADVNYAGGAQQVTAMQIAAASGDAEVVRRMLAAEGDVLKKNASGQSALDLARKRGIGEALALIEEKAKIQQAAVDAAGGPVEAIAEGLPAQRPVRVLRPLTFRRR